MPACDSLDVGRSPLVLLFILSAALAQPAAAARAARTVTHRASTTPSTEAMPASRADPLPAFDGAPTIVSARSGDWSVASTWRPARIPTSGDVVSITSGASVLIDSQAAVARTIGVQACGRPAFRRIWSTRLTVGTLLVHEGGTLEIGTSGWPMPATVRAELVIADQALDTTADPQQFGTGLLGQGRVSIVGAALSPTFVRLAAEPRAGTSSLTLQQPVTGWRTGDRLFLPDSKQWAIETEGYTPRFEEATLRSISSDGKTLNLTQPTRFDHPGARAVDGHLDLLPHVANLTRNVVIRSAKPNGTRGHAWLNHRAAVIIANAQLRDLGRTPGGIVR